MTPGKSAQEELDDALALLSELRDYVYKRADDSDPALLELLARVDGYLEN